MFVSHEFAFNTVIYVAASNAITQPIQNICVLAVELA